MTKDETAGSGRTTRRQARGAAERARAWQKWASGIALNVPSNANTVVYVHGIGNKPPASVLKCQWDRALFGVDLGEGGPEPAEKLGVGAQAFGSPELDLGDLSGIDDLRAVSLLRHVAAAMWERAASHADTGGVTAQGTDARVLPLPRWMRESITRRLTRKLLPDVYDFLFDDERRKEMKERLRERLLAGGGPFVVIAHSQGSMIAYDVLRELRDSDRVQVCLLVTMGSPLGLDEV